MEDRLLSRDEVAEMLGVPAATLAQWAHRNVGPQRIKVGRHVRYRPADVTTWIDASTVR